MAPRTSYYLQYKRTISKMANNQANGTASVYATSEPQFISLPSLHSQNHQTPLMNTLLVQPIMPVIKATIRITVQKSIAVGVYALSEKPGADSEHSQTARSITWQAFSINALYNNLLPLSAFSIALVVMHQGFSKQCRTFAQFEYLHVAHSSQFSIRDTTRTINN